MTHHLQQTDRSYRRGAIMGLTIAEAFILIAFALLLLFAFWQWEVQKENTPEVQAYKTLPQHQREIVLASVNDGSLQAFVALKENGFDFASQHSVQTLQEKWRFIDKDDQRRLLDAVAALPEDAQRDLADMVEADQALLALNQMAALQDLVKAGQDIQTLLRQNQAMSAALAGQSANEALLGITGKIAAAEAQKVALVGALKNELGGFVSNVGGQIDNEGAIILPDAVLFEQGQANVTPQLGRFLAQVCGPWLTVLKNSGVQISEVKIEGHASSEWREGSSPRAAYLGNLNLSQQRSQTVLRTCLDFVPDQEVLEWAREHMIAVGYSSVRPVLDADGTPDPEKSRRVVFSATPNKEALIDEIENEAQSHDRVLR